MKIFMKPLLAVLIATSVINDAEATNVNNLSSVLKEIIESPLSTENTKVQFDLLNYQLKDKHIANIDLSFKISSPLVQLSSALSARHPKLGATDGLFKGMSTSAVLTGLFEIEMSEPFLVNLVQLANEDESLDPKDVMKPFSMKRWEEYLKSFEEAKDLYEANGMSIESRIVKQNAEGLIESFAVVVKNSGKIQGSNPSETEFIITMQSAKVEIRMIQLDPTMSLNIFDKEEQNLVIFLENLQKRDPATMVFAKSMIQLVKSYFDMLSSMPAMIVESVPVTEPVTE